MMLAKGEGYKLLQLSDSEEYLLCEKQKMTPLDKTGAVRWSLRNLTDEECSALWGSANARLQMRKGAWTQKRILSEIARMSEQCDPKLMEDLKDLPDMVLRNLFLSPTKQIISSQETVTMYAVDFNKIAAVNKNSVAKLAAIEREKKEKFRKEQLALFNKQFNRRYYVS